MRKGKGQTKIVSTSKSGMKKKRGKDFAKGLTRKVRRTHKGYGMKKITGSQMTYKRKARKR